MQYVRLKHNFRYSFFLCPIHQFHFFGSVVDMVAKFSRRSLSGRKLIRNTEKDRKRKSGRERERKQEKHISYTYKNKQKIFSWKFTSKFDLIVSRPHSFLSVFSSFSFFLFLLRFSTFSCHFRGEQNASNALTSKNITLQMSFFDHPAHKKFW